MKRETALKVKKIVDAIAAVAKPVADLLVEDEPRSQSAVGAVDKFGGGTKDVIDVFTDAN